MNLHGDSFPLSIFQGLCHSEGRMSLVLHQSACCPLLFPFSWCYMIITSIYYIYNIYLHSLHFSFSFLHSLLLWNLVFVELLLCFQQHFICVNYCHPSYCSITSLILHVIVYPKLPTLNSIP